MDTKNQLFRYLYYALIELRANAYERDDQRHFAIADLLHNLPLKLAKEEIDYEQLLNELKEAAASNQGLTGWLAHYDKTK